MLDSLCASAVVVIDILPVNDAPIITNNGNPIDTLFYQVDEDIPLDICIQATDIENQSLSISEVINSSGNGRFDLNIGLCMIFTPALDFNGIVTTETIICDDDNQALCDTVVIVIDVLPVNDPPTFLVNGLPSDTLEVETFEDQVVDFCLDVIDLEDDLITDPILIPTTNLGSYGKATTLCYEFTPNPNTNGIEYATVTACDTGPACVDLVIKIIILPVNDQPIAVDDFFENNIYRAFAGNVLTNDADIEGQLLTASVSNISGLHGRLEFESDGGFQYIPSRKFVGEESFTYQVCDNGTPSACDEGEVFFTLNDPLIIWQAVSPNRDNMNDQWIIEGIDLFPDNKIQIFDRYNNLVYEVDAYNNQDVVWHGQSNRGIFRSQVPEGTYFYLIDLGEGDKVPLRGFLILKNN